MKAEVGVEVVQPFVRLRFYIQLICVGGGGVFTLKLASKFDISDINFIVASVIVAVCGLTFEQLIKQKWFSPARLMRRPAEAVLLKVKLK